MSSDMNVKVLQVNKPQRFQENAGVYRHNKNWFDWKNRGTEKIEKQRRNEQQTVEYMYFGYDIFQFPE